MFRRHLHNPFTLLNTCLWGKILWLSLNKNEWKIKQNMENENSEGLRKGKRDRCCLNVTVMAVFVAIIFIHLQKLHFYLPYFLSDSASFLCSLFQMWLSKSSYFLPKQKKLLISIRALNFLFFYRSTSYIVISYVVVLLRCYLNSIFSPLQKYNIRHTHSLGLLAQS